MNFTARITGSAVGIPQSDLFPIVTILFLLALCLAFVILLERKNRTVQELTEKLQKYEKKRHVQ